MFHAYNPAIQEMESKIIIVGGQLQQKASETPYLNQ
jgi:hypothetical protein